MRNTRTRPKLFCSECGAKAQATCDCGVHYLAAGVAAALAVAEHPEKSDRAIAKETGIPRATLQRARKSTGPNGPVDKRIGLDGKTRRLPQHCPNVTPEEELQNTPVAAALLVNIRPIINALKTEGNNHAMSPDRVGFLANQLRTEINESLSPISKARSCAACASEWEIDGTKPNKDLIDAVRKAANAWTELLKRLLAAAAEKEKSSSPNNVLTTNRQAGAIMIRDRRDAAGVS
jgi:hypothetical protein